MTGPWMDFWDYYGRRVWYNLETGAAQDELGDMREEACAVAIQVRTDGDMRVVDMRMGEMREALCLLLRLALLLWPRPSRYRWPTDALALDLTLALALALSLPLAPVKLTLSLCPPSPRSATGVATWTDGRSCGWRTPWLSLRCTGGSRCSDGAFGRSGRAGEGTVRGRGSMRQRWESSR